MAKPTRRTVVLAICAVVFVAILLMVISRLRDSGAPTPSKDARVPAPVEVAPVEHGPIELRRIFSGTLESPAQFIVAPKVGGRVEKLVVDLADPVQRGQVVAELDDDEYVQSVAQAEAELAVARANLAEAKSSLEIANRDLERVTTLRDSGIGSESQLDVSRAAQLGKKAAVEVAHAQVTRAEATLNSAKIRLGYTKVVAAWSGGDDERVVARRHVDEGNTVAANTPLLTIVELNPITAVIHLTGKDYARLQAGQAVTLTSDGVAGHVFTGQVTRVAPVFQEASRQARADVTVANPQHLLKPGLFVRAEAVLGKAEDATIVPLISLTTRDGESGLFVLNAEGQTVTWRPVEVGITHNDRVQVIGDGITGRVVTLGQQLLNDGSAITIPEQDGADGEAEPKR